MPSFLTTTYTVKPGKGNNPSIPWQEKAWRRLVSMLFGARIACFWFDHPQEQCTTGTSYNGRSFHCAACGYESFQEWPE